MMRKALFAAALVVALLAAFACSRGGDVSRGGEGGGTAAAPPGKAGENAGELTFARGRRRRPTSSRSSTKGRTPRFYPIKGPKATVIIGPAYARTVKRAGLPGSSSSRRRYTKPRARRTS